MGARSLLARHLLLQVWCFLTQVGLNFTFVSKCAWQVMVYTQQQQSGKNRTLHSICGEKISIDNQFDGLLSLLVYRV